MAILAGPCVVRVIIFVVIMGASTLPGIIVAATQGDAQVAREGADEDCDHHASDNLHK